MMRCRCAGVQVPGGDNGGPMWKVEAESKGRHEVGEVAGGWASSLSLRCPTRV